MLVVTFTGGGAGAAAAPDVDGDAGFLGKSLDRLLHLPLAALGDRARGDLGRQRVLGGTLAIHGGEQRVFEPLAFGAKGVLRPLNRGQRIVGSLGGLGEGGFELDEAGGVGGLELRDLPGVDGVALGGASGRGRLGRLALGLVGRVGRFELRHARLVRALGFGAPSFEVGQPRGGVGLEVHQTPGVRLALVGHRLLERRQLRALLGGIFLGGRHGFGQACLLGQRPVERIAERAGISAVARLGFLQFRFDLGPNRRVLLFEGSAHRGLLGFGR